MRILLFLLFSAFASGTDYFSPQNILKFANFLYAEGDYSRAAGEYLRYLSSGGNKRIYAWKKAAQSFENAREYEQGIKVCKLAEKEFPQESFFPLERANLLLKEGKYDEVKELLNERKWPEETEKKLRQFRLIAFILQGKWEETFKGKLPPDPYSLFLKKEILKRKKYGWKSPAKAAILSAIIPGAGKMYTGRWKDGFYSLLIIGLSGWQAYSGFKNGAKTKGYFFAGLTAFFYAGNVYGSAVAAKIYNSQMDTKIQKEITITIPLLLE